MTPIDQIRPYLDFAIGFYKRRANIKIVPAVAFDFNSPYASTKEADDDRFFVTASRPSSFTTLDVRCRSEAVTADLSPAGSQFQIMMSNLNFFGNARRLIGLGAPVCIFAVRRFLDTIPTSGCTLPVLARYITISFTNAPVTTIAHELGHLCGLLSDLTGPPNNLMGPPPAPELAELNDEQVFSIRSSNYCSLV